MMMSDDKVGGWVKKGQNHDDVTLEWSLMEIFYPWITEAGSQCNLWSSKPGLHVPSFRSLNSESLRKSFLKQGHNMVIKTASIAKIYTKYSLEFSWC